MYGVIVYGWYNQYFFLSCNYDCFNGNLLHMCLCFCVENDVIDNDSIMCYTWVDDVTYVAEAW